ncbi:MAG: hypothetical protein JWO36_5220 [Myxococcales bacterium]|nr:hypothetical protein [Myxococcales bacterium]
MPTGSHVRDARARQSAYAKPRTYDPCRENCARVLAEISSTVLFERMRSAWCGIFVNERVSRGDPMRARLLTEISSTVLVRTDAIRVVRNFRQRARVPKRSRARACVGGNFVDRACSSGCDPRAAEVSSTERVFRSAPVRVRVRRISSRARLPNLQLRDGAERAIQLDVLMRRCRPRRVARHRCAAHGRERFRIAIELHRASER